MDTNYPVWYQSSEGPKVSQTVSSLSITVLPFVNMLFASKGINIMPESVNFWVSIAIFVVFSIRTGLGYIKAKKIFGAKIAELNRELGRAN